MILGQRFYFRPVLTVCAALALAVLVSLGSWQLQRLEWKRELIARVDEAMGKPPVEFSPDAIRDEDEYRPVYADGVFVRDQTVRVFGTLDGAPGAYVFDPFVTSNAALIYVNRGFVPQADLTAASAAPVSGPVRVEGLARRRDRPAPPASWFRRPGPDASGYWYVRDPVAMAAAAGMKDGAVSPFYIDQYAVENAGAPRGGTTRLDFRNKHLEYALTWFGLAGVLAAMWLIFSFRKP